jgi:hypothetical protein
MAKDGHVTAGRVRARAGVRTYLFVAPLLGALMIAWAAAPPARAGRGPVHSASGSSRAASPAPLQGVYEYCAPAAATDGCVGRLRQIAAAGFGAVLNYAAFDADRAELERYMKAAAALGLKLIWPIQERVWWQSGALLRSYARLAADCDCSGDDAFLRYVVGLIRSSPATWGYYMADEQAPQDARLVAAFSRRVHTLDRSHPRLAVAVGDDTVARLLAPYAAAADVLGADSYPIGAGQPVDRVGTIGRAVGSLAATTHRQSAMVLQAFDWSSYPHALAASAPRWPTRAELRQMRDLAISTAHPSLILWYSYFNILQSPGFAEHWRDLVWAAFGT